jgi:outer membrane protein assembly factor BamB
MIKLIRRHVAGLALVSLALWSTLGFAQSDRASIRPLRTAPTEKFTVNAGVRDWGPATIAGQTILAGGPSGRAGLFAVDMLTGKLKWTFRPAKINGSVSTPPAVAGNVVIAPFGAANPGAVVAVSLATGKELWRTLDPAVDAAVATHAGLAYVMSKDGSFSALEAATGREVWKAAFGKRADCVSGPVVRDDIVYLSASTGSASYLFAFDAKSGQERWRYQGRDRYSCLRRLVVTADTIYGAANDALYAINRASGNELWKPIEIRRPVEGKERSVQVHALVDGGAVLIGTTAGFLIAFDKATGATLWEMPGKFGENSPSLAVAGNVLYFQGRLDPKAEDSRGVLHAMDLDTQKILWSFSRTTAEPNWSFGYVTPVDDGLWVDSYKALVKLQ